MPDVPHNPEDAYRRYLDALNSKHEAPGDAGQPVVEPETTPQPATQSPELAAYIELFGDDEEALAQYEQRYLGTYATTKDYVHHVLTETDAYQYIDDMVVLEDLRRHVSYDLEAIWNDWYWAGGLALCQLDSGQVAIFDLHT